ncbi:MAG: hypothetical protein JRN35_06105 [Nitrososphaerota archaeon]|nr:hypothetical protein [Nitrososphaerota archaeon]
MMEKTTKNAIKRAVDFAELLENVRSHVNAGATKCLVIFGTPNDDDGLDLTIHNVGFDYTYEIDGFIHLANEVIHDNEDNQS